MDMNTMNILNGAYFAEVFKQAFKASQEEIIVFNDVLSCGPLRKYTGIESWRDYREAFWNTVDNDRSEEKLPFGPFERDFYSGFEAFEPAHEFGLLIGTGLLWIISN